MAKRKWCAGQRWVVHKFIFYYYIENFLKVLNLIYMKILIIAAHPDDEILGIGGSIAKWAASGNKVDVKILAEGSTSRDLKR